LPVAPFNTTGSGTISTRQLSTGQVEVVLRLALENTSTPLVIELLGQPEGGGITMRTSHVRFGTESGTVTSLHGSSIQATLSGNGESLQLSLDLTIDSRSRTVSATISGRSTR
jgi:hypothetical protein